MNRITFFQVISTTLTLLAGMPIFGETVYPPELKNSAKNFPESIPPESIFKVTGTSSQVRGMTVKKWPYRENTYIAYAEKPYTPLVENGCRHDCIEYDLHILHISNKTVEVKAHYHGQFKEDGYRFSHFDFAPYKLRNNLTAIGIRFHASGPIGGGGWERSKLILYEYETSQLRPVLSTIVSYGAMRLNASFENAFDFRYDAIIVIGKPDSSGYNRIIWKHKKKKHVFRYSNDDGQYVTDKIPACFGDKEYCFEGL